MARSEIEKQLGINHVRDNGGKTADRYTVILSATRYGYADMHNLMLNCLCLSENPTSPQGVNMFGSCAVDWRGDKRVAFADLPANIQAAIKDRLGYVEPTPEPTPAPAPKARYWHILGSHYLNYGDWREVKIGETLTVEGEIKLCKRGLHASARLTDALDNAQCPTFLVCRVELGDVVIGYGDPDGADNKVVSNARTVIAWLTHQEFRAALQQWGAACLANVLPVLWPDAPMWVREFAQTGKMTPSSYPAYWHHSCPNESLADAIFDMANVEPTHFISRLLYALYLHHRKALGAPDWTDPRYVEVCAEIKVIQAAKQALFTAMLEKTVLKAMDLDESERGI